MKELNISSTLSSKRREKGITQEELANYMGVSKASVSKWETGQSYPDIVFLPVLATYFNISIDELMGYAPQMTKEDIKKLYHHMSTLFAEEPFDQVIHQCRTIIKKYYSCFPLLFQMAVILVNHHMLAPSKEEQREIVEEASDLCIRIRKESDDVWLSKEATSFEAICYLLLQQPEKIMELLGEDIHPIRTDYEVMAQAHQMLGNPTKANQVTQIGMYQHLLALVNAAPAFMMLNRDDHDKFEEILHRGLAVAELFNLEDLHPNTMAQLYLAAAGVYGSKKNKEKTLRMLQKYADVCTQKFFSFSLHGDSFFDAIDEWFDDFDLGAKAPRDIKTIKKSMYEGIASHLAFSFLENEPTFKNILESLRLNIGDEKI